MSIQSKVYKMYKNSSSRAEKEVLKVLVEQYDSEPSKEVTDSRSIVILKELINETNVFIKNCESTEQMVHGAYAVKVFESLLPQMTSMDAVEEWIRGNIDMSAHRTPLSAMRQVVNKFGISVNNDSLKTLLNRMYIQQQGL